MLPAELHKSFPVHPALWRGSDLAHAAGPCIASGFHALDAALPGGGWPVGALTELLPAHEGIGELRVLGHALATLVRGGNFAGMHLVFVHLVHGLANQVTKARRTLWAL